MLHNSTSLHRRFMPAAVNTLWKVLERKRSYVSEMIRSMEGFSPCLGLSGSPKYPLRGYCRSIKRLAATVGFGRMALHCVNPP